MGELIHLKPPIHVRAHANWTPPGVRQQFIAKRQIEKARLHATVTLGGAFLTSASITLGLYLLAWL